MLKDVSFPVHRRFKSRTEWEPIGFFSDCLCNSTQFNLMLGFFSSSAINVLADGFASFLYNGGRMSLIINDILTEQDKNAIAKGGLDTPVPFFNIEDLENLKNTLSERDNYFFDCLSWLIQNNRLDIKIVVPKEGVGISHTKTGFFFDGVNNVGFDGSCNFSRTALVDNIESLTVSCDWDGNTAAATVKEIKKEFDCVFNGDDENVVLVTADKVRTRISESFKCKDLKDLLEDEYKIIQQDISNSLLPKTVVKALDKAKNNIESRIEKLKSKGDTFTSIDFEKPRFPYESGPRDYQKKAFENWKNNNQKGLFAMATGTGKTITSLNCLLEIYNRLGYYKAIILVPTITLVEQWEKECEKFNFRNIIKISSKNHDWKSRVANIRMQELIKDDDKTSYIIISTYASFVKPVIFMELNQFSKKKLLLIADEAHNIGSGQLSYKLSGISYSRRIGLSATPERQYDDSGNKRINEFFCCEAGYTFEYNMEEAIKNGALCKYYYYPHIVKLTSEEMREYAEVTKHIVKYSSKSDPNSQEKLKILLLKRKRIIHKAENKKTILKQLLERAFNEKGSLKYTLVYVPEGNRPDDQLADIFDDRESLDNDEDTQHLIDDYTKIVKNVDHHITVRQFTSESKERDIMLEDFATGILDVLTSMKCLDEGVDVPRSELAIFCSSTGNPRQFIQRRGRVLRTHKDKRYATIHDLVVVPDFDYSIENYVLEKKLVEGELKRVRDFALLSENLNDTDSELADVLNHYNLSIFN
ncbi:MAG: DEAD/DEAH box helicase family protein [Paludibacteraceae bacterium]|nr:DEAD/DEAH box helicase family protein [Paludibacteraceae bacterium]